MNENYISEEAQAIQHTEGYYINNGRKSIDFFIGFIIGALLTAITMLLFPLGVVLDLIALIVVIKLKRRYLIFGALLIILIPLVAFGACFVLLAGTSGGFLR